MKWVSNTYDPNQPDAMSYHLSQDRDWYNYVTWLHGKIVGRPQASEAYTVEQLEAMHYVGIYEPDPD